MNLICLSDTHNEHPQLTPYMKSLYEDHPNAVLVHAGDSTNSGSLTECTNFLEWFGSLPFEYKIFIPGNHDTSFEFTPYNDNYRVLTKLAESLGITILINSVATIDGVTFMGVSKIPRLHSWAFYADEHERQRFYGNCPQDIDVIVSHCPPHAIADTIGIHAEGRYSGCSAFRDYIYRNDPKVAICGHIHERYGVYDLENGTKVVNCAVLNERYQMQNLPIIVDVPLQCVL